MLARIGNPFQSRAWALKMTVFSCLVACATLFGEQAQATSWPTAPSSFGSDLSLSCYGSGMTFYNYNSPNNGQGLTNDSQSPTLVPGQSVPAISAIASLPAGTFQESPAFAPSGKGFPGE